MLQKLKPKYRANLLKYIFIVVLSICLFFVTSGFRISVPSIRIGMMPWIGESLDLSL